ncbi:hypothetical protein HY798_03915 [Candidatus Falkowbacteria bacterium]|nr:hypothetical protein [Candidatus Falkowbacteria bacterium]
MSKSEIRKDYLLNKYVIITPGRIKRPRDIKEETIVSRTSPCPFCPENIEKKNVVDVISAKAKVHNLSNMSPSWIPGSGPKMTKTKFSDILKKDDWRVLAIKNIFPAVSLDNSKAYGTQEVIIETPDHVKDLAELSAERIEQVLKMYARRTAALSKNSPRAFLSKNKGQGNIKTDGKVRGKKIDYILCFKNQGSKAGASIVHAHSQIFATAITPPEILEELNAAQNYQTEHKTCPYCDILKKELKSPRKIYEDKWIAAFTPYASQYHYEAWIFTKRHLDNITKLNPAEFAAFAKALKKILAKLQGLDLSFNYFLHQVVSAPDQHFYLKIQPRASVWAGVELGSGLVINSVAPEEAAFYYRKNS